ncbi:MAG: hypothetical protein KA713_00435 [Chryseotalea sp. WA131a]|jgi:hypothetical protein|nr:MAG: hypothetical protein KA713_00435 [Chryseotalea sp. WA131a]
MTEMISPGLYLMYGLMVVALIASVGMPIYYAIKHPAELIKSLVGIAVLVILFGVSYAFSGSEVSIKAASMGITPQSSKLIGAGMIMFYITMLVATVLIVFSMIRDVIKN